jgi:hypothetical protein
LRVLRGTEMTLDQAVQKLIAYAEGNGGFDELDFKEYLFEVWLPEQMKITRNKEVSDE